MDAKIAEEHEPTNTQCKEWANKELGLFSYEEVSVYKQSGGVRNYENKEDEEEEKVRSPSCVTMNHIRSS